MAILRRDDWITDTQGRALSGALVWYCSQPATVANPPSPLATVYSNLAGTIIQAQPLVSDGYGHVAVYLNNGQLYTVVFYHILTGLLSYPDQNAGASGNSLTPTSAVPTGSINGSNVTFTLPSAPVFPTFLMLNLNGVTLTQGLGYTFTGSTITMAAAPQTGDTLNAFYI